MPNPVFSPGKFDWTGESSSLLVEDGGASKPQAEPAPAGGRRAATKVVSTLAAIRATYEDPRTGKIEALPAHQWILVDNERKASQIEAPRSSNGVSKIPASADLGGGAKKWEMA